MENQKPSILGSLGSYEGDVTTWALPEGAIARLGRGREPDIVFSPDEQYLAIGNSLGLWMYDFETLSPRALWETERGMVGCVAFSPNGKWIAASNSDQVLKILDILTGECLAQVETEAYISGMTFSPDSQYLAAAYASSSTVEIWQTETCESERQYYPDIDFASFYRPISISPDSQLIASTFNSETYHNADEIVIWEVGSGEQIAVLNAHKSWVSTLCFSPCGRYLASGGEDGIVYEWDIDTWKKVQTYTDYGDVYRIIPSYTPNGILRAAIVNYHETDATTISVHNLNSGEQLYSDQVWGNTVHFTSMSDWGTTVVFSSGSQLAYENRHEFINVWTSEKPDKRQFTHSPISYPTSALFSDDGKTLAVKHHHEGVVLWDVASRRSRPAVDVETAGKNQFVYNSDSGKLYVASIKDDNVRLWEANGDGVPLIEGTGRKYWSAFPALSPTGKLFAYAGEDGILKVWDIQSGKQKNQLTHPLKADIDIYEELGDDYFDDDYFDDEDGDKIETLKFSYDGKILASESTGGVKLWDMESRKEIGSFSCDIVPAIMGFSPCGQYLACNGDELFLWDTINNELRLTGLNYGPYAFIGFSPCGRYLACSGDETFLYDLKQHEIHVRLSLPQACERMYAAVFSSCGNYFAGGGWWKEGTVKMPICLWEVETRKHIVTFLGHPTDVQALAFSPDNKLLASASYDGSILLWDVTPYTIFTL